MRLIIDIGNTLAKVAVMESYEILELFTYKCLTVKDIEDIAVDYDFDKVIVSAVGLLDISVKNYLDGTYGINFLNIIYSTPMPIINLYATPETLGVDRLMSAIGARVFDRSNTLLVVDMGSAITFDVISSKNEFLGGNISPGVNFRFKSLNLFTKKLPLCSLTENITLLGENTNTAVVNGVVNGILYEIEGYIRVISEQYESFSIFFTGGDGKYFADKIKKAIFVKSNLTLIGIYEVSKYNYDKN